MGRITARTRTASATRLDDVWGEIDVVEVDDGLVRHAAALAVRFGLRGYDAIHCASADQFSDADLIAAAGDGRLLDAWHGLGIATFDPTGPGG